MSSIPRFAAIVAAGVIAALGAPLPAGADDGAGVPPGKWEAWTELGGTGANHDYARRGEAALWAPIAQDARSLFFADLRGKLFADDQREGNAALGYRFMGANGWNPGFWIGLDRRDTALGTSVDQFSFGAELLSADWDLRVNGYLPLNDSELIASTPATTGTVFVTGGNIFMLADPDTALYELAFGGFDAEVGFRVPLERLGWESGKGSGLKDATAAATASQHDFRVFLGGFYFDHEDFDGDVAGPRVRAEWRIENAIEAWEGSRLTFEAAYQYDDVREDQFEAGLHLRIPLGHASSAERYALSPQEKRMAEGIKRDTDIVAVSQTRQTGAIPAPEPIEDALSGVDLNRVVFVPNGGDLEAALLAAGPNTLVVANGGAVSFDGVMVFANQTLLGGGGDLQLRGRTTGALGTYTAPGVRPIIGNCCVGIYAQDNAHIAGVVVFNNASAGIEVWEPNSSIFVSNTLIDTAFIGIYMSQDNTTLTMRNTTIQNVLGGVYADAASPVLDIRNSTIRNAFEVGIGLLPSDDIARITVADTVFDGFVGGAFVFVGGVTTVTGSTGNVDHMTIGARCLRDAGATFTGSIGFSDNTTVTAANCALTP